MRLGKSLTELATEIERQRENKKDFVAPSTKLAVIPRDIGMEFRVGDADKAEMFGIADTAHDQLSDRLDIPRKYYDRLKAHAPALLAENVNHWLRESPENRLVRTLDGNVRAVLSDRYRPLENADLFEAIYPVLMSLGVEIMSADVTEKRLYIKAVDKNIQRDIPNGASMGDGGHTIFRTNSPAIVISNSEIGNGALAVETAIWDGACTNLAVFKQHSLRKYHSGAKHSIIADGAYELLSTETRALTDKAVWAQAGDIVRGAFNAAQFDARLEKVRAMAGQPITGDPIEAVAVTAKHFGLTDGERNGVLKHLITGGDLSRMGIYNAITRTAEDAPSYDRATEMERLGGEVIRLPSTDWKRIAAGMIAAAA